MIHVSIPTNTNVVFYYNFDDKTIQYLTHVQYSSGGKLALCFKANINRVIAVVDKLIKKQEF